MPARAARSAAAGTTAETTGDGVPAACGDARGAAKADGASGMAPVVAVAPTPADTMRAPRMRAMRSSIGGCVENRAPIPLAKKKWLNSACSETVIMMWEQ
jgi:hypothetical protein